MKAWLCMALLVLPGIVRAQVHCGPADTFETCSDRLAGQIEQKGAEAAKNGVALKNTGDATASTINDFLPLLRALVDTGGFSSEGGRLGFEWSNPFGLPEQDQNKLTVALQKSQVYEPLGNALRAASLGDQVAALEDQIDEGDDISIGFSYSRASERYGRDPRLHADILSALVQAASVGNEITDNRSLTDFERRMLEKNNALDFDGSQPFEKIGLSPADQTQYIRLVEEAIQAHHRSMRAFGERLRALGLYGFLDLVNNQPQWSFTASYHARDERVGPDELRAVLSYEKGWANVNAWRDHERRACGGIDEMTCLSQYLSRDDVITNLKQSLRVSFRAEYSKLQRLGFSLPDSMFTYSQDAAERFSLSAAIGRYIGGEVGGITRSRIDASLGYVDFSDDPTRQDRGLVAVTLTYPVSEGFYLSVGAVYATKPEFRGDVDSELSARAGLLYKLIEQ